MPGQTQILIPNSHVITVHLVAISKRKFFVSHIQNQKLQHSYDKLSAILQNTSSITCYHDSNQPPRKLKPHIF